MFHFTLTLCYLGKKYHLMFSSGENWTLVDWFDLIWLLNAARNFSFVWILSLKQTDTFLHDILPQLTFLFCSLYIQYLHHLWAPNWNTEFLHQELCALSQSCSTLTKIFISSTTTKSGLCPDCDKHKLNLQVHTHNVNSVQKQCWLFVAIQWLIRFTTDRFLDL